MRPTEAAARRELLAERHRDARRSQLGGGARSRACVLGNEGSAGAAGAQGLSRAHIHGVDELSIGLLHHVDGLLASVGTELSDQPVSGRLVSEACQTALDDQVGPRECHLWRNAHVSMRRTTRPSA